MLNKNELKISDESTIYHPIYGQLCYSETNLDCVLYHPLRFKNKEQAKTWIESGYFEDIQEKLTIGIGFTNLSFIGKNNGNN